MSRSLRMPLCLAFFLVMAIAQSFAMDVHGDKKIRIPGTDEWVPASYFFPVEFEKKARHDAIPLPEEASLNQPMEADEASAWNSPPDPRAGQGASGKGGHSSSRGGSVVEESSSGLLGSLKPDQSRFRNVEYPLDSTELAHLYPDDGSRPVDFALLSNGASEDGRHLLLEVNPVKFYPEPQILNRLQRAIIDKLQALKIPLGKYDGIRNRYLNGKIPFASSRPDRGRSQDAGGCASSSS